MAIAARIVGDEGMGAVRHTPRRGRRAPRCGSARWRTSPSSGIEADRCPALALTPLGRPVGCGRYPQPPPHARTTTPRTLRPASMASCLSARPRLGQAIERTVDGGDGVGGDAGCSAPWCRACLWPEQRLDHDGCRCLLLQEMGGEAVAQACASVTGLVDAGRGDLACRGTALLKLTRGHRPLPGLLSREQPTLLARHVSPCMACRARRPPPPAAARAGPSRA